MLHVGTLPKPFPVDKVFLEFLSVFSELLSLGTDTFQASRLAERFGILLAFLAFRMKIRLPFSRFGVHNGVESVSDNADRYVKEIHFFFWIIQNQT